MNERLKKLRKTLDMTQRAFGERIGVKGNTIAQYEIGRNEPIDAVISLICREFNVNETWLRAGEGEMFVQRTEADELSQVFSAIAASDDELIKRIIRAYWKLDDKEKAAVKKLIEGFSPDGSGVGPAAPAFAPAHTPTIEEEARAEANQQAQLIYQQILSEKKAAAGMLSESSGPLAGGGTVKQA